MWLVASAEKIRRFSAKNAEDLLEMSSRNGQGQADQRLRPRCRTCHRISAMIHLRHLLTLLVLLGCQVSMIAPEELLGVSLAALPC
jgi:hypothetical protein